MESVRESYLESDYCEEGFLSPQADAFAGANAEEKASACSVRNDGGFCVPTASTIPVCGKAELLFSGDLEW